MKPNCPYAHPARFPIEYFNPATFMSYPMRGNPSLIQYRVLGRPHPKNVNAVYRADSQPKPAAESQQDQAKALIQSQPEQKQ